MRVWYGAEDDAHFVRGPGEMRGHVRQGFTDGGRTRPLDRDTSVAPGVTAVLAPGHTPGAPVRGAVLRAGPGAAARRRRDLPVQLDEPSWHSIGDVDPALADRTRERLRRELEDGRTVGAGAHFPELRFGRVLAGTGRRWHT